MDKSRADPDATNLPSASPSKVTFSEDEIETQGAISLDQKNKDVRRAENCRSSVEFL